MTKNNRCGACASGKRASGAYASGERRVCERRCTSDPGRCRERAFSRAREAAGESRPARAACARAASHDRHLTRADPRGQCVRVCVRAARVQAAHARPPPPPPRPRRPRRPTPFPPILAASNLPSQGIGKPTVPLPAVSPQPAAPNPPLRSRAAAAAHRRLTLTPPHTRGPPTGWLNPAGWYNGNRSWGARRVRVAPCPPSHRHSLPTDTPPSSSWARWPSPSSSDTSLQSRGWCAFGDGALQSSYCGQSVLGATLGPMLWLELGLFRGRPPPPARSPTRPPPVLPPPDRRSERSRSCVRDDGAASNLPPPTRRSARAPPPPPTTASHSRRLTLAVLRLAG